MFYHAEIYPDDLWTQRDPSRGNQKFLPRLVNLRKKNIYLINWFARRYIFLKPVVAIFARSVSNFIWASRPSSSSSSSSSSSPWSSRRRCLRRRQRRRRRRRGRRRRRRRRSGAVVVVAAGRSPHTMKGTQIQLGTDFANAPTTDLRIYNDGRKDYR